MESGNLVPFRSPTTLQTCGLTEFNNQWRKNVTGLAINRKRLGTARYTALPNDQTQAAAPGFPRFFPLESPSL